MKNTIRKMKQNDLLAIGFAFLFSGILLISILDSNRVFQVIGVIMLLIASVAFGASIKDNTNSKK